MALSDQCLRGFKCQPYNDFTFRCVKRVGHDGKHRTDGTNGTEWASGAFGDCGEMALRVAPSPAPDPRDAELSRHRDEIKRMCEERDSAQACITRQTEELSRLRARVVELESLFERAVRVSCKLAQACIDSTRFNTGASFSIDDTDEVVKLRALLAPAPEPKHAHACQIARATSGASDCGLSPCEDAAVHLDLGQSRPLVFSRPPKPPATGPYAPEPETPPANPRLTTPKLAEPAPKPCATCPSTGEPLCHFCDHRKGAHNGGRCFTFTPSHPSPCAPQCGTSCECTAFSSCPACGGGA